MPSIELVLLKRGHVCLYFGLDDEAEAKRLYDAISTELQKGTSQLVIPMESVPIVETRTTWRKR